MHGSQNVYNIIHDCTSNLSLIPHDFSINFSSHIYIYINMQSVFHFSFYTSIDTASERSKNMHIHAYMHAVHDVINLVYYRYSLCMHGAQLKYINWQIFHYNQCNSTVPNTTTVDTYMV